MKLKYSIIVALLAILGINSSSAQVEDSARELLYSGKYSHAVIWASYEWILNPVYGLQSNNGLFKLDGKPIYDGSGNKIKSGTNFYSVLPGTLPGQNFFKLDQSSAAYIFYKPKERVGQRPLRHFFEKNTYILGITHDKMGTSFDTSAIRTYRLNSGGVEFTFMICRVYDIRYPFGDIDLAASKLNMNFSWQIGAFLSCNDILVNYHIPTNDTVYITSVNKNRVLGNGEGIVGYANLNIGYKLFDLTRTHKQNHYKSVQRNYNRSLFISIGNRLMGEVLHTKAKVNVTYPGSTTLLQGNHYLEANTLGILISPSFNLIFKL